MIQAEIDGNAVRGRENLHEILAEKLKLPEWYGKNLDALYDCLTEPGEEIFLPLRGWEAVEKTLGGYAKGLLRALEGASRAGKRFRFAVEDNGRMTAR